MKQSRRLLIAFGIALAALTIGAAVLVFVKGGEKVVLLPEGDPAGVVQRYLLAIQKGDYTAALQYVARNPPANSDGKPLEPIPAFPRRGSSVSWRATLGATRVTGAEAQVDITVHLFRPSNPFGDPVQTINETYFLVRQDSAWLIRSPGPPWWLY